MSGGSVARGDGFFEDEEGAAGARGVVDAVEDRMDDVEAEPARPHLREIAWCEA